MARVAHAIAAAALIALAAVCILGVAAPAASGGHASAKEAAPCASVLCMVAIN